VARAFNFPRHVTVRVKPAVKGVAISLLFEMLKKNKFGYPVFVNAEGVAELSGEELLKAFDETKSTFINDYVDPRRNFTGRITAKALSVLELDRALKAFEMFRGKVSYPVGYEENLRAALASGQDPDDYKVEITVQS
jgi:hypothetical protein